MWGICCSYHFHLSKALIKPVLDCSSLRIRTSPCPEGTGNKVYGDLVKISRKSSKDLKALCKLRLHLFSLLMHILNSLLSFNGLHDCNSEQTGALHILHTNKLCESNFWKKYCMSILMQLWRNSLEKIIIQQILEDLLCNFKWMFTNVSKLCVHQQCPERNQPFSKPTEEPWS